jgi:hypothetical protein
MGTNTKTEVCMSGGREGGVKDLGEITKNIDVEVISLSEVFRTSFYWCTQTAAFQ